MDTLESRIYSIQDKCDLNISILLSDSSHPVFKAHFPGQPILPGFIQLEIASTVFEYTYSGIKKSKFIKPIYPEDVLTFVAQLKEENLRVKIYRKQEIVTDFILIS
jgi:3-hydroxyacyl-[acyl-carrier-protein] dehydratase